MNEENRVREALGYINPSCDYMTWLTIGMALKDGGFSCHVWDEWSSEGNNYEVGLCEKKWESFKGDGITIASLYFLAHKEGWHPTYNDGWQPRKRNADSIQQLSQYLLALHDVADSVGIVTQSAYNEAKDKWHPANEGYTIEISELLQRITNADTLDQIIGEYNPDAGAWIRVNPLDGFGAKDENVTSFNYVLVESDDISRERQKAIIDQLQLPVAALVDSGGKSIHAIVRVDARNEDEYTERVRYLFKVCENYGLEIDQANKNPSRMSRLPGAQRGNATQTLLGLKQGCETWEEWTNYIHKKETGLPQMKSLKTLKENPPQLAPPLIDGILRQGRKMLVSGASKTGKSFALIGLAYALAYGREWLGFKCTKTKVLYLNLEIADDSFDDRLVKVAKELGITDFDNDNLKWFDMRGINQSLDTLKDKLVSICRGENFGAIILDPIYKVSFANENDAQEMAEFCNSIDYICQTLNTAMIYCHHHSKGSQSGKSAIDRMSGSGVLARDPDAIIDLLELEYTPEAKEILKEQRERDITFEMLDKFSPGWRKDIEDDKNLDDMKVVRACPEYRFSNKERGELRLRLEKEMAALEHIIPIRLSASVREFPPLAPVNIYFKHPIHLYDTAEAFFDARPIDQVRGNIKVMDKEDRKKKLKHHYMKMVDADGYVDVIDMAAVLGTSEKTVKNYLKEMPEFQLIQGTNMYKKSRFKLIK